METGMSEDCGAAGGGGSSSRPPYRGGEGNTVGTTAFQARGTGRRSALGRVGLKWKSASAASDYLE